MRIRFKEELQEKNKEIESWKAMGEEKEWEGQWKKKNEREKDWGSKSTKK